MRFREIIIITILSLTPLLWYKPGTLGLGHDMGFPLNPIEHFTDRLSIWTQRGGFGHDQSLDVGALPVHGLEALISTSGISIYATQKIEFVFYFALLGLSMYFLLYTIFPQGVTPEQGLPLMFRVFGSIFYMFNHFTLQGWFIAERTKFGMMAALPIVLALIIRFYRKELSAGRTAVFLALTFFFLNGGGFLPLYGSVLITLPLAFIFFAALDFKKNGWSRLYQWLKLFSLFSFLFSLLNFYWILPQVLFTLKSYQETVTSFGGLSTTIDWAKEISKHTSFLNLFRLQGIPDWYDNPNHPYAKPFLENSLLILVSFVWPILAFFALIAKRDRGNRRNREIVFFFGLLLLVSAVFAAGTHPPLGGFYEWLLRHFPGFTVFRTPFYKFAPALWLSYAVLISFFLSHLRKLGRLGLLGFLSIIGILLYCYPFFTGSFFNWRPGLSTMVKAPDYVFETQDWINENADEDRILLLPPLHINGRADIYRWGYFSLASLPSMLTTKPTLAYDRVTRYHELELIGRLSDAILRSDPNAFNLAKKLGIGYFLLRKDVWYNFPGFETGNPAVFEQVLEQNPALRVAADFGEAPAESSEALAKEGGWKIYKLKDPPLPLVYAAELKRGYPLLGVTPQEPDDTIQVSYNRINSSHYQVTVKYAPEIYNLVFNEAYDERWEVYVNGEKLPQTQHAVANDFANFWEIHNKGKAEIEIIYGPQKYFELAHWVSGISLILVFLYFLSPKFELQKLVNT